MGADATDSPISEAGKDSGLDDTEPKDGEGFGGPGTDEDRVGPAGADPGNVDSDEEYPEDGASMVSG